jgi:hypothetical protein
VRNWKVERSNWKSKSRSTRFHVHTHFPLSTSHS